MEAIRKTENVEPCRGMISPNFYCVSVPGILAHQNIIVIVTNTVTLCSDIFLVSQPFSSF